MAVPSLPSRCILILMAAWCKFIEVKRERDTERRTGAADGMGRETMIDLERIRGREQADEGWMEGGGEEERSTWH